MVISEGSPTAQLTETDLRHVLERALAELSPAGKRVLAIIPDHTRSGPTGTFFRIICDTLKGCSAKTDFLIAGDNPGSKLEKAKKAGVKIISEQEFVEMMEENNGVVE